MWFQAGACSGDTLSILNSERPNFLEVIENYGINLLFHPSLSICRPSELDKTIEQILNDEIELTIFCLEGTVIWGPDGTGMFDSWRGKPKKDLIEKLCNKAQYVIAVGSCSSFGGVPTAGVNPSDSTGLQFLKEEPDGGLLEPEWRSKSGYPVINLSGCPSHPNTMVQTFISCIAGIEIEMDHLNRPLEFFGSLVHQGCTRNEYHEFDVEDKNFGSAGCLFYNLGCQGPYTMATCNSILWNNQSSKTRAGTPCFGCTAPSFPKDQDLFKTEKIGDIPKTLPLGVDRAGYMSYKGLAKQATPQRLKDRKTKF